MNNNKKLSDCKVGSFSRLSVSGFDELENNKIKLKKPSSSLHEIEEGYLLILN